MCAEVSADDYGEDVSTTIQRHHSATPKLPHLEMEFEYNSHRPNQVNCYAPRSNTKSTRARIEESLKVIVELIRSRMKGSSGSCALRSVVMIFGRMSRQQCGAIILPPPNCCTRNWSSGLAGEGELWVPKFTATWSEGWRRWRQETDPSHTRSVLPSNSFLQRRNFLSRGGGDEDGGFSKHFVEDRVIGYSREQIFAVVAGVDMYQDFVPWCQRSEVLWRKGSKLDAELEIGFKFLVERYISHVHLSPPNLIKSTVSHSNIFDYLNNEWRFEKGPTPDSCHLHFMVDFQFKSALYRKVANLFFHEVQARLVSSFEERCKIIYSPSVVSVRKPDDK